ncbi:TonB-dependent receptor [Sphingomonas sp. ID1715]|uniref:TonB-dependent receptor plug domain-containing protein n=1 Tax=Sphingomonas sp. ID1715 TaxID=1656898 RepID=UPI0014888FBE|nr:TonB-dependent receptor [Sphingomonas sp. ID1715]NNM75874.1 TonB-dependent receptor [Sphingomonas sp. ID1715]
MRSSPRARLLASSIFIVPALWASGAAAQTAADTSPTRVNPATCANDASAPGCAAQSADGGTATEEAAIVVTGSRIVSPVATAASPLQVVDSRQIASTGAVNVQDVLLQNPAFGTPSISRTNSSFATASAGVATVDLRNLGVDRTLVLVNGRRFVSGIPGSNAVDLNVIPTQFIERVDVLTGGASALYGSDAVAGVVNFIYKQDFEGIQADGQTGITQRGDGFDYQANLLAGKNFADGRGNIMVFAGYSKQGTIYKKQHGTEAGPSDVDQTSLGGSITGKDEDLFTPARPFLSGYSPRGRYYAGDTTFTYDPVTNALRPCSSTNGGIAPDDCGAFAGQPIGPDGFNRSSYRYLAVPVERYVGALRGNFEVSDALNLFVEGNYARTQVRTVIEPFPLDSSYIDPTTGGQIAIESVVNGVTYRNPFVPDAIFNAATDTDGDGLRDIFFDKRLSDFGGRTSSAKRDTFRIAGGVNGKFWDDWSYEVYGVYGQTKEHQTGSGQFNSLKFQQALNAIREVNDIDGDGDRTEIICTNADARAAGCVPANIYGPGSLTPAVGYLAAPSTLDTKVTQTVAGANVSGGLFSLFGNRDKVSVAVGGEYRKETSSSVFDELTQLGLNGGNALPSTKGKFDLVEGYGEVIAPILQDRPFFNRLTLRGAVRVSKYSTVGTTFSYNYGGEWSPIEDVRFRVMQARSVRAPNVDELFSPPQQDFPSGLQDPCIGVTATDTGTLATNCRAAPGVAANIAANGAFTVTQADVQGITSFGGGNPQLQEEKGDSFTAGVVINPRSLGGAFRNLVLTVDYFDIKIKDAIVDTPLQFILDQCYNGGNQALCQFITRRPAPQGANSAGSIDQVNNGPSNSGGVRTSGIDTTINWRSDLWGGSFGVRASYTHLFKGYSVPLPGSDRDYFAGEIGAAKDRFTTSLSFDQENGVGATLTGTYIGASYLDDQLTGAKPGANKLYRVASEFYLDGQVRFNVGERYQFYVGANNLLDNKAPFLADIGASAGQDTDAGTYDAIGRRFYAGARLRF